MYTCRRPPVFLHLSPSPPLQQVRGKSWSSWSPPPHTDANKPGDEAAQGEESLALGGWKTRVCVAAQQHVHVGGVCAVRREKGMYVLSSIQFYHMCKTV